MAINIQTIGQHVIINGEPVEPAEALQYSKWLKEAAEDAITTHLEDCIEADCAKCASATSFGLRSRLRSV